MNYPIALLTLLCALGLSACNTTSKQLKAPCNERSVSCGEKIKINGW